jgi:hypothetical protein
MRARAKQLYREENRLAHAWRFLLSPGAGENARGNRWPENQKICRLVTGTPRCVPAIRSWAMPSSSFRKAFSPANLAADSDLNPALQSFTPNGFGRL